MSHQDKKVADRLQADYLKLALQWLLTSVTWSQVALRSDCSWTPTLLASSALLWAWSDELTLGERFRTARSIIVFLFPGQQTPAGSYQAFTKILRRWTASLVACIQTSLRDRLPRALPEFWLVQGFMLFGVDGSRVELPRTVSNESCYAASRKKKRTSKKRGGKSRKRKHSRKADAPHMWLTTMLHIGAGLPWDWRTGPADSSERAHLLEMLAALPQAALIAADAGFVGYEYAQAVLDSGRNLLIRVGANVRLLKKLGYAREVAGTVYLWPDRAAQKNQPPLVLRLVVAHNGKHPVYLLTSVLFSSQLSDQQVIALYARRWGVELFYRNLKQTFQRRKLRSTTPDNAEVEMQWSYVGLWAMALYALVEAAKHGTPPNKLSIAQMLLAFRRTLRDYRHPRVRGQSLCARLRLAVIDSYVRKNKASRNYPRKKQESPPGSPIILHASRPQVQAAQRLRRPA